MPECKHCDMHGATAYFRRSPTNGYICYDREACKRRQLERLNNWGELEGISHKLLSSVNLLIGFIERSDSMRALSQLANVTDRVSELVAEIAIAAAREKHTQKEIAGALNIPVSTLRGLKASL